MEGAPPSEHIRQLRRFQSPNSARQSPPVHKTQGEGLGRGLQGRGRGSDKGPITVTRGISERQKKPSGTRSFNRLLPASVLSRQRSRAFSLNTQHMESEPIQGGQI